MLRGSNEVLHDKIYSQTWGEEYFSKKDFSKQYSRPNLLGLGVNFGNDYNHSFSGPPKRSVR